MSGSASTLVTSTMQMSGEFTQAYILDAIINSPVGNLAIFIYIIAAIGFFLTVALFQNYKMAVWLIIGPALWDISANTRTEEININWMYAGQIVKDQEWLAQFNNRSLVDDTSLNLGPATVYTLWDGVVSSAVQNLTGLISAVTNDPATRLFAKTNIQEGMLSSMISNPNIREAMKIAMGPDCTPMIQVDKPNAQKKWSFTDIARLELALENRLVSGVSENVVRELCVYKIAHDNWLNDGLLPFESIDTSSCSTDPWGAIGTDPLGNSSEGNCLDFSRAVWEALEVEAELRLRSLYKASGGNGNGVSAIGRNLLPDWSLEMLSSDPNSLRRLVAAYSIRNEMDTLNYDGKKDAVSSGGEKTANKDEEASVLVAWLEKESAQSQAVMFSQAVPYLQGALLYVLAIVYPFICIIMLIPGFHTAMITWMAAWAWVKSWDVMFYVVSLLSAIMSENVLHMGMLHNNLVQNEYTGVDGSVSSFADNVVQQLEDVNFLHLAVYTAFDDMDPKFSAGIINYIVALATVSIPALTGIFFLWGRASSLNLFSDGLKNKAQGASDRTAAQLQDKWLRDIEIQRQRDVRQASFTGAGFGAGLGFLVGNMPGALIGSAIGAVAGEKDASIYIGYDRGQQAALVGGRPMVLPSGDVLDPLEVGKTAAGAVVLQQYFAQATGSANYAPMQQWIDSPDRLRLRQNMIGGWQSHSFIGD